MNHRLFKRASASHHPRSQRPATKATGIDLLSLQKFSAGFTLVELVLALALGALLMAAMVGVLKGAAQQMKVAHAITQQSWHSSTLEQLHKDMLLAAQIRAEGDWIWLSGEFNEYSSDQPKTRQVGYRCVPWVDQRGALVRWSTASTELVAIGPRRILVERLDSNNAPQPLSAIATPMPARVRVWIWTEDAINAELTHDIVLR